MKLPPLEDIPKIVQNDLSICLNEHTAHIDDPSQIARAWVTCGEDEIADYEIGMNSDGGYALEFFFRGAMAQHGLNCWREIARMLLPQ